MKAMTAWMGVVVGSMLVTAAGCDPKVAYDDDDDATDPADEGSSSGDEPDGEQPGTSVGSGGEPDCGDDGQACPQPPPDAAHAYAIRFGDLPEVDVGGSDTGAGSGGDGGATIDPDTLLVVISNGADGCDDPWAAMACGQWRISFNLPPGTAVGSHALSSLNGTQSASGPNEGADDCWWGGGTLEGTLELASTDGAITGHIVDAEAFDFDANVAFVAALCP